MSRELRKRKNINYKEVGDIKLPRAEKKRCWSDSEELFPVRVVEKEENRVRVHYVGYPSKYNEWKEVAELECLEADTEEQEVEGIQKLSAFQPYSLYNHFMIKIKQSLVCGRKTSPVVRITMLFDLLQFNGGLKEFGIPSKMVHGTQHFKIRH